MPSTVIYDGPSQLDGSPIIVALTGLTSRSRNQKTGRMAQTYVLCRDISPTAAIQTGADSSICGNCPHRGGACYVLPHRDPTAVWRNLSTDRSDPLRIGFQHRLRYVRLGAYGDPAAAPLRLWQRLSQGFSGHTGYTHQWRTCDPDLKSLCMASVDNENEANEAQVLGWRTFRVKAHDAPILPNEVQCPNQTHGVTCNDCGLCAGTSKAGKNITANVHGAPWKQKLFLENAA